MTENVRTRALAIAGLLVVSACARPEDPVYAAGVDDGKPMLAATAPDGTRLWAVTPPGSSRRVYFSAGGTQTAHTENCGKNCNRTVDDFVPATQGDR